MAQIEKFIHGMARIMALIGGTVMVLLIVLTCLSVLGRNINGLGHLQAVEDGLPALSGFLTSFGSITGDFELLEAGIAFAILSFLPWCQVMRGHASVDIFTTMMPETVNRWLAVLWEGLFAFIIIVITWRMYIGMHDKMRYGETTFLLEFPVWWGFAAGVAAAAVASVVAVYCVWERLQEALGMRTDAALNRSVDH